MSPEVTLPPSIAGQSRDQFLYYRLRFRFNLCLGLILDRVRNVDGVELRPAQRRGLGSGGGHELVRRHRHRRDSHPFQLQRIVQTARSARPSIGQRLDHRVGSADFLQDGSGRGFREGRLHLPNHRRHTVPLLQQ